MGGNMATLMTSDPLEEIQRPDVFYYCTLILVRGLQPTADQSSISKKELQ
jgi:hypothetical protein